MFFWIIYPKIWVRKKFNFNNEEEKHSKFIRKTFEKCLNRIWKIFENPLYVIDIQAFTKATKITYNDILVRRHGIIACSSMRHSTLASAHYCCNIIAFFGHKFILYGRINQEIQLTDIWQMLFIAIKIWQEFGKGWQEFDNGLTRVDKSWQEFDNELTDIWQVPCKSLIIWYLPQPLLSTKAIRFSRAYSHRLSSINNNSKTCFISDNIKNWCKYKENGNIMS